MRKHSSSAAATKDSICLPAAPLVIIQTLQGCFDTHEHALTISQPRRSARHALMFQHSNLGSRPRSCSVCTMFNRSHVLTVEERRSIEAAAGQMLPVAAAVTTPEASWQWLTVLRQGLAYSHRHAHFLDQTALKPKVRLETMALMKPLQLKLSSAADAIATPACTVRRSRLGQIQASCATQQSFTQLLRWVNHSQMPLAVVWTSVERTLRECCCARLGPLSTVLKLECLRVLTILQWLGQTGSEAVTRDWSVGKSAFRLQKSLQALRHSTLVQVAEA